jgi:DNA-binding transcriptional ArsR family regulator
MREREILVEPAGDPHIPSARLVWILQAHKAGGLALAVGLLVLRLAAMQKADAVELCVQRAAADLDANSKTIYRALDRLAAADLITLDRRKGAWPRVELVGGPLLKSRTKGKTK